MYIVFCLRVRGPTRATQGGSLAAAAVDTRQALAVLSDLNQVALVQNDAQAFASYAQTQRLNRYILLEDPSLAERNILVSPVSGGGIRLTRLQMLFLREALVQGYDPDQWKLTEAQTRDLQHQQTT